MERSVTATNGRPRVLLGQLAARGDCLYATAIARQIKQDLPGCHLTWAIGSMCRDIIRGNPYVDAVWEFPAANHDEVAAAWDRLEKEAAERKRRGDFDLVYLTQVYPNNFGRFDGTVRTSIFRGYPRRITVPVNPVVYLDEPEIARVRAFAERHRLTRYRYVILFECASSSGQSFVTVEYAQSFARVLKTRWADLAVVLSSHVSVDAGNPAIVDGSELSFRENAELSKYCHFLIGCSSGISWLCTSNWAKKLPTIQLLRGHTSVFASVAHDFEHRGEPTDHIIEMADCPPERLLECVGIVLKDGFQAARPRYHEPIPLQFTFYSEVIEHALHHQLARRGRYWLVFQSMWHTICRYGPRPAILGAGFGALAKARRKKFWSFRRIARVIVDRLYRTRPFAFRRRPEVHAGVAPRKPVVERSPAVEEAAHSEQKTDA